MVEHSFDFSVVYHYIRGQSLLKLYVLFNMLEIFERLLRSTGVDLFDDLVVTCRSGWRQLSFKYLVTLLYCFLHTNMHLVRVLLLNVAINTSESAMFMIVVTNNFAEIKSTVFKKYQAQTLFPIVTSDVVERVYLLCDILFVVIRMGISPHGGMINWHDVIYWLIFLVVMEIGTDWLKFGIIVKWS